MAITTSCCLNFSSSPATPASDPSGFPSSKPIQLPWHKNEKWRRQCVVSMACMIIGMQMADFEDGGGGTAIAKDMNMRLTIVPKSKELVQVPRWSDKRLCPPWRLNSLETIVPENLPRPSARRRSESIHYSSKTAPAVTSTSSSCFSM